MNLSLLSVRISFKFLDSGWVSSNWGPTIRGGFGTALKAVCCGAGINDCRSCCDVRTCAYACLFESPVMPDSPLMKLYTNHPHPFIFDLPPATGLPVAADETVDIGVTLVGTAITQLPYVIQAFRRLGHAGLGSGRLKFQVVGVAGVSGDRAPVGEIIAVDPGLSRTSLCRLNFISPLRLQVDGRLARQVAPVDIVRGISRRAFLLGALYCGGDTPPLPMDFVTAASVLEVTDCKMEWVDHVRFSTRQEQDVPQGGLVGSISFRGDVGCLEPLLRAGERIHVGKNATFGLGRYVMTLD